MQLIRFILFGTVFLTGAAVLIMEVAAVRLLTPYFGSSLYVLSSVLTIILLALSLGYYLGGKTSDRLPFVLPLYMIITCAGVSLMVLLTFATQVLPLIAPLTPIISGPLIFSALFFFLPAFLLGIDSPYVIKLLTASVDTDEAGRVVGATFFWSTAGGIVGSLAAGFVLIPYFGLLETLLGTSIVVTLLGVIGGLTVRSLWRQQPGYDTRNNRDLSLPILITFILLGFSVYFMYSQPAQAGIIYQTDGYYSQIQVYETEIRGKKARIMKRDTNHSSAINLEDDEILFPYAQFAPLYKELLPEAESFLMLGGGAYTIPRSVHQLDLDIQIDVVELEPVLYNIAKTYFDLPESERITNHVTDARVFVNQSQEQYDVIFIDTYNSGHFIPPHLVTEEFFTNLEQLLTPEGVIIVNLISPAVENDSQTLLGSILKTYLQQFPNTKMYLTVPDQPLQQQNIMLMTRRDNVSLELPPEYIIHSYVKDFSLSEMYRDPNQYISEADMFFTDNHSPVELLIFKNQMQR